jgi:peroxiredoxin
MTIKVGDKIPHATLRQVTPDGAVPVASEDFFAGRKVVLFGLPGAFTPTCHKNHLPGFIDHEAEFKAKGIAEIALTSVNDHYVLEAWAKATGAAGHVTFLADGNGEFAKALGLELDAAMGGLGLRSKRYSALIDDGVVKLLFVEESPGKADLSGASHLLAQL